MANSTVLLRLEIVGLDIFGCRFLYSSFGECTIFTKITLGLVSLHNGISTLVGYLMPNLFS